MTESRDPIRYAIYTRQSVETPDDVSSCEAQRMTCQDFAKAVGGDGELWCGESFDDDGYSGHTLDRPAVRRLREIVAQGEVQRVYAVALDRLSRSMRDAVTLLDEFERAGVELLVVHQAELTANSSSRFLRHVLAAFAEFERDMIADRIRDARARLKRHGRRLAGKVPYGYDADPVTKQLVPNPIEADRVRAIFARAADGERPSQIAAAINALDWRTKKYESQRSGVVTGGGPWTARQIIDTLRNPVYLGQFADGATTRPGAHKPIIDQTTFDAARAQLIARRTRGQATLSREDRYPLRRKIICPQCGRRLTTYQTSRRISKQSQIRVRHYVCRSTAGGRPGCRGVRYNAYQIEDSIRSIFAQSDIWPKLLGDDASDDAVQHARRTWDALDRSWQLDWMRGAIDRIEQREATEEITLSFVPDAARPFLAQNQGNTTAAVNRQVGDE